MIHVPECNSGHLILEAETEIGSKSHQAFAMLYPTVSLLNVLHIRSGVASLEDPKGRGFSDYSDDQKPCGNQRTQGAVASYPQLPSTTKHFF